MSMRRSSNAALFLLCVLCAIGSSDDTPVLIPGRLFAGERIALGGSRVFGLSQLEPHSRYEVRISYLGSPATMYSIQVFSGHRQSDTKRELQDTEIVTFETDGRSLLASSAPVSSDGRVWVEVTCKGGGVAEPHGASDWEVRYFNIIVEKRWMKAIPLSVAPLMVVLGLGGALTLLLSLKMRRSMSQQLGHLSRPRR